MFEEVKRSISGRMAVDRIDGVSKLSRTTQKYVPNSLVFALGPSFIVIEIVFRRVKWPEKSLVRQQTFK
jgi:hypothetical protein